MSRSTGLQYRLAGVTGLAFVALFIASGFAGASELSGVDQTGAAIAQDLLQNRRAGLQASVFLLWLAAIAGFLFLGFLHNRLAAKTRSPEVWAALAGGLGLVISVMVLGVILSAMFTVDSLTADPQTAKTLWLLEQGAWIPMTPALVAFILGISVGAMRNGDPPRWLGWAGLLVSAVLFVNTWFGIGSPVVLGFLWVLVLAIVLAIRLPLTEGALPESGAEALT